MRPAAHVVVLDAFASVSASFSASASVVLYRLTAPLPGVDVPDVLQSPSASLNKITARHVMNCCHFCLRQATLLSGKHLTSAGQQLSSNYPHQLTEQTTEKATTKYTK